VFINANGFLTFESGFVDWSHTVDEFLDEQARIAVWADFNSASSGTVTTSGDSNSFSINFSEVPTYPSEGSNTFGITLFSDGSFDITLETMSAESLLISIFAGGGKTGTAVDFSTLTGPFDSTSTIYERFPYGSPLDIQNRTLHFERSDDNVVVPEPETMTIFALGLIGMAVSRKKKLVLNR